MAALLVLVGCSGGPNDSEPVIFAYRATGPAVTAHGVTFEPMGAVQWPRPSRKEWACGPDSFGVLFRATVPEGRRLALYEVRGKGRGLDDGTRFFTLKQPARSEVRTSAPFSAPEPIGDGKRIEEPPWTTLYHTVGTPGQETVGLVFLDYQVEDGKALSVVMEKVGFEGEAETWSFQFENIQLSAKRVVPYDPNPIICGDAFWKVMAGREPIWTTPTRTQSP